MSSVSVSTPPRVRPGRPLLAITLSFALALGLGAALVADRGRVKQLSDAQDRVIISVPRSWSDDTTPQAGGLVDRGAGPRREPDLVVSPVRAERSVQVKVEPRRGDLARRHAAEVDDRCYSRACVDRGQPVAVVVNGRPGLEQVLTHASAEWTVLLTLESESQLVSLAGQAGDLGTGPEDLEPLLAVMRTAVLTR